MHVFTLRRAASGIVMLSLISALSAPVCAAETAGTPTVLSESTTGMILPVQTNSESKENSRIYVTGSEEMASTSLEANTAVVSGDSVLSLQDGLILAEVPMYSGMAASSQTVCTLPAGAKVTVMPSKDGATGNSSWTSILWGDNSGYVPTDKLELDASEEQIAEVCAEAEARAAEKAAKEAEEAARREAEAAAQAAEEERLALRQQVVDTAMEYLGYPYVYGTAGPNSFDCSGFTMYIMGQFGYSIERSSANQFLYSGESVSVDELELGDLLYFRSGGSSRAATHAALYIGDGQFIHAQSAKTDVVISSLSDRWYADTYVGAKRILP